MNDVVEPDLEPDGDDATRLLFAAQRSRREQLPAKGRIQTKPVCVWTTFGVAVGETVSANAP